MTEQQPLRLAITVPELLALGIPLRQVNRVYAQLQQAVRQAPQLNEWPTLAQLASRMRPYCWH